MNSIGEMPQLLADFVHVSTGSMLRLATPIPQTGMGEQIRPVNSQSGELEQ